MPLAILQNELTEPTADQLAAAFVALPKLTHYDAKTKARDVSGLLATNLNDEQATILLGALAEQGIATSIVEEDELTDLPTPYRIKEAWPSEENLIVMDSHNQSQTLEWSSVTLIAAGLLGRTRVDRETRAQVVRSFVRGTKVVNDHVNVEHQESTPIAEVLLTTAPFRLRIEAKQFRFGYLGEDMPRGLNERFDRLVMDLASFAPHAAINRGTDAIIRDVPRRKYRSMRVFEQEMIWLNWLTGTRSANTN